MQPFVLYIVGDLHLGAPFQYAMGMSQHVDVPSQKQHTLSETILSLKSLCENGLMPVVISGDVYNSEDHVI